MNTLKFKGSCYCVVPALLLHRSLQRLAPITVLKSHLFSKVEEDFSKISQIIARNKQTNTRTVDVITHHYHVAGHKKVVGYKIVAEHMKVVKTKETIFFVNVSVS